MSSRRVVGLFVAAATIAALVGLVVAPRAAVAAGCAAGFQDAGGGVCTATFVYTGAPESVTLPAGVSIITATVSGAEGGTSLEEQVDPFGGAPSPGGKGGRETATIAVAPGATLTVVVGQAGTGGVLAPPGYGGYGGGGHATSRYGGNGGGGSFVFDASGPLIVAGGGGGGGYDYNPIVMGRGDQQAPGGDGSGASAASDGQSVAFCCDGTSPYTAGGGGGATPNGPGLGGHPSLPPSYIFGQADGDSGSGPAIDPNNFGNGGNTHNGCCYFTGWAGGGGGGYYGGGGGGNVEADLEGGGGGGGAGYVVPAAMAPTSALGVQVGDGEVTISYTTGGAVPTRTATPTPSVAACAPAPLSGCVVPANGLLKLQGNAADRTKQKLKWQWGNGTSSLADFGHPISGTTNYRLCVYDDGVLKTSPAVVSGGTCNGKPCWTASKTGLKYKNKSGNAEGIIQVSLKSGTGTAKVIVQGKGSGLTLPFPITDAVAVITQLVKDPGSGPECWEGTFPPPAKTYDPVKLKFLDKTP